MAGGMPLAFTQDDFLVNLALGFSSLLFLIAKYFSQLLIYSHAEKLIEPGTTHTI